jgi:hypothetical protein
MDTTASRSFGKSSCDFGFVLAEVVISSGLAAMLITGLVFGYLQTAAQAEWSAYSLAAQSLAQERVEQGRACAWNPYAVPPIDELVSSNFPVQLKVLDVPSSGTNAVRAANFTTIATVSTMPPLRMIKVDCVWSFMDRGMFTNSVVTYRGPD